MTILKCDKCGKEILEISTASVLFTNQYLEKYTVRPDELDLCSECTTALKKWLKGETSG